MRDYMEDREPESPVCQSCGMPMHLEEDFGDNLDGTKNYEYCKFCFKNGTLGQSKRDGREHSAQSQEMARSLVDIISHN
jgi:hypothetical protein